MAAFRLFLVTIFFPLLTIVLLWRRPRRPVLAWAATFLLALGLCGFSFLAAPWGWYGLPARYALLLLFVLALVFSWRRALPAEPKEEAPLRTMFKVLLGVFFTGVAVGALSGRQAPADTVNLSFPFHGGSYLVAHGGSSGPSNMHSPDLAQHFAVDLVKLNGAGMRAHGIYPAELARYEIFGAQVLSPCAGNVVSAVDGVPDAFGATIDEKKPFGNHVVLRCGDLNVTVAQLQQGSVSVRAGASVAVGQLLGRAGNSGLSSEPHLHVHADRAGVAVPIRFDGRWLVRNDVVR